jgi:hypothetical protein
MPKVKSLVNGFRYGGASHDIGDEFEMTQKHTKIFGGALGKVRLVATQVPAGTAMRTLVAPEPMPVPTPEPGPAPAEAPQTDEGQVDEETRVEDAGNESADEEGVATRPEGQTYRPARGSRGSRTRS